ncbi:MAG: hypothetical protein V3T86_04545 [Planctomycetota bacterium]
MRFTGLRRLLRLLCCALTLCCAWVLLHTHAYADEDPAPPEGSAESESEPAPTPEGAPPGEGEEPDEDEIDKDDGPEWVDPPEHADGLNDRRYQPPPDPDSLTNEVPECSWAYTFKFQISREKDEQDCGFWPDPCIAKSWARAQAAWISGAAFALDKTMFNTAQTSSSTSATGFLHVWRTDSAPCGSKMTIYMHPSFKAFAEIDPPSSAKAGGNSTIFSQATGKEAKASGTVNIDSQGGRSVTVGGVPVPTSGGGGNKIDQVFQDLESASFPGKKETLHLSGDVSVSTTANAYLLNGHASSESGVIESKLDSYIYGVCSSPCTKTVKVTLD